MLAIKDKFESESVLTFTHEFEKDDQLAFLDCLVTRLGDCFGTSVHVKETSDGTCLNYNSTCPERYKIGVVTSYLHRAHQISSTREVFAREVSRIKQLLTNNNFPMSVIDATVSKFMSAIQNPTASAEQQAEDVITLYFRNQMTSQYKNDEAKLKQLINTHVAPTSENSSVKLIIIY